MDRKKDLVIPEEIERCLRYVYNNKNKSAQEQLLKLLQEMQITLEEPKVEDSIDGTRICFTYATAISRKRGGVDEGIIRFQYIKEVPVDYGKLPIRLRDNTTTGAGASAVDDTTSPKIDAIVEDAIIESYDE